MKLNLHELGKKVNELPCVVNVDYASHICIISYKRYGVEAHSDLTSDLVSFYGEMIICDNGNITYSNDIRPTHPLRHLVDLAYRKYQHKNHLTFGQALEYLKKGYRITRKNWGGYWYLDYYFFSPVKPKASAMIVAHYGNGVCGPAQAYQCDMLADDWEEIGKESTDEAD